MNDIMKRFSEKEIKWSQWSPEGMIAHGVAQYQQIMQWMQALGIEAKKSVMTSEKDHAIYGKKMHDDCGRLTEIRLYCDAYVTDEELFAIKHTCVFDTLFVAHK